MTLTFEKVEVLPESGSGKRTTKNDIFLRDFIESDAEVAKVNLDSRSILSVKASLSYSIKTRGLYPTLGLAQRQGQLFIYKKES